MQELHKFVANTFRDKKIRIYEAGGGSISKLPLASLDRPEITVVDNDETQLRDNSYAQTKILGDIQSYSFPPDSFEVVVCYNVIEHLDFVDQAIKHFHHALVPGGLLIIGAPNPESFSGFVTKLTPHWFHVGFYRIVLGRKAAGQPGQPPFRTVYHPTVSPKALSAFCAKLDFEMIYFKPYSGEVYRTIREASPALGRLLYAAVTMMNVLTFGRRDVWNSDYHAVFAKRAAPASSPPLDAAGDRRIALEQ